jgi:hypothetical protein
VSIKILPPFLAWYDRFLDKRISLESILAAIKNRQRAAAWSTLLYWSDIHSSAACASPSSSWGFKPGRLNNGLQQLLTKE